MFTTANTKDWLETPFASINLEALNAKEAMLERLDHKYVVDAGVLFEAIPHLLEHFDILEINHRRSFIYETCYFDDEQLSNYFHHHQGRRQRVKVRTRHYLDNGSCFLEMKLKDTRGSTVKKRLIYDIDKYGTLDNQALEYLENSHQEHYQRPFDRMLCPQLEMTYRRITLVAHIGNERMTIDSDICFGKGEQAYLVPQQTFIIETKSNHGRGFADRVLRQLHQHPTNKCSKYCLGMILTGQVLRANNFKPTLRKLFLPNTLSNHSLTQLSSTTHASRSPSERLPSFSGAAS